MAENIREEIRRLNRTKRLFVNHNSAMEQMQDSESSGSEMGADSPRRPDSPPSAIKNPEMALFTFKQVIFILFIFFFANATLQYRTFFSRFSLKIYVFDLNLKNVLLLFSGANDMRTNAEGERGETS